MNKVDLRNKYRVIRKKISNRSHKDEKIYNNLINTGIIDSYKTILVYVSTKEEVDTVKIIKYLLQDETKKIAIPKIINDKMEFYIINDYNELRVGAFNILEPIGNEKITNFDDCLCITPGICFDKKNYRVGYGKGFYDKFFEQNKVFSIGLCYKECLIEKININVYDKNVNMVITD